MPNSTNRGAEGCHWDRSAFAMTPADLEIHEARMALRRLLDGPSLSPPARRAVRCSLAILEAETPPAGA